MKNLYASAFHLKMVIILVIHFNNAKRRNRITSYLDINKRIMKKLKIVQNIIIKMENGNALDANLNIQMHMGFV